MTFKLSELRDAPDGKLAGWFKLLEKKQGSTSYIPIPDSDAIERVVFNDEMTGAPDPEPEDGTPADEGARASESATQLVEESARAPIAPPISPDPSTARPVSPRTNLFLEHIYDSPSAFCPCLFSLMLTCLYQ
eukprot:m.559499 g.559499  ORF g.559499 m.559499 type:complete len:133 (+) comp57775_c0_seq4:1908-2306(+)